MNTLIVSKTKMQHGVCVGGILYNGTSVRILDATGHNQPADTPYDIGDIWNLTFTHRLNIATPHVEDILVTKSAFSGKEGNIINVLTEKIKVDIYEGDAQGLFDGLIRWTGNGSGYICERIGIPNRSVGFFRSTNDLVLAPDRKHYIITNDSPFSPVRQLKYVGLPNPIARIPAGTMIRISLARWWKPDDIEIEERCYAQLSGWY